MSSQEPPKFRLGTSPAATPATPIAESDDKRPVDPWLTGRLAQSQHLKISIVKCQEDIRWSLQCVGNLGNTVRPRQARYIPIFRKCGEATVMMT